MTVCFLITTYNRHESCQRLVDSLQGQGDIVVVGDAVDYTITGCSFFNLPKHNGKRFYYKTVKQLWSMRGHYDYYFMLPDDFLTCDIQIKHAIELWESITDPQKICLNLYADRIGLKCWTHFAPIDKGNVWQTGWVDMCFMAEERFFNSIFPLRDAQTGHSSGVGAQISRSLVRHKYSLFQVKESLVYPQPEHGVSQMHSVANEINKENSRHSVSTRKKRITLDSRCLDKRSGR